MTTWWERSRSIRDGRDPPGRVAHRPDRRPATTPPSGSSSGSGRTAEAATARAVRASRAHSRGRTARASRGAGRRCRPPSGTAAAPTPARRPPARPGWPAGPAPARRSPRGRARRPRTSPAIPGRAPRPAAATTEPGPGRAAGRAGTRRRPATRPPAASTTRRPGTAAAAASPATTPARYAGHRRHRHRGQHDRQPGHHQPQHRQAGLRVPARVAPAAAGCSPSSATTPASGCSAAVADSGRSWTSIRAARAVPSSAPGLQDRLGLRLGRRGRRRSSTGAAGPGRRCWPEGSRTRRCGPGLPHDLGGALDGLAAELDLDRPDLAGPWRSAVGGPVHLAVRQVLIAGREPTAARIWRSERQEAPLSRHALVRSSARRTSVTACVCRRKVFPGLTSRDFKPKASSPARVAHTHGSPTLSSPHVGVAEIAPAGDGLAGAQHRAARRAPRGRSAGRRAGQAGCRTCRPRSPARQFPAE